jgi:hypothetical protein
MVAMVSLLGPALTMAPNASASTNDNTGFVELTLAGEPSDVIRVRRVVHELLEREGIATHWHQSRTIDPRRVLIRQADGTAVRIWIDVSRAKVAQVYLAGADGERIVVRRIPLSGGLDETGRELIGQVVQSSALALVHGDPIGMTRDEASRVIDSDADPAVRTKQDLPDKASPRVLPRATVALPSVTGLPQSPAALAHYRLGLGYAAQAFAGGPTIEHGPVLSSALGFGRGHTRLLLWFDAQYRVPVSVMEGPIGLRIDGFAGHMQVGLDLRTSQNGWFGAAVGFGGDFVRVLPERTTDSNLTLAPVIHYWTPTARTTLLSGLRVVRGLELSLWLFSDFGLRRTHFDIREGSARTCALTPWQIRPGAGIGILLVP